MNWRIRATLIHTAMLSAIICFSVLSRAQSEVASCTTTPPAGYTVIDLGSLGIGSAAFGINSTGDVTGEFFLNSFTEHAFLLTAADGMKDLGTLPGGTNSVGLAVNDSDEVVGVGDGAGFKDHAFLWTGSDGMQDLGALGSMANLSTAYGIDDAGRIVGGAYDDTDREYSTAWVNGRLRTLTPTRSERLVPFRRRMPTWPVWAIKAMPSCGGNQLATPTWAACLAATSASHVG